MSPVVAHDVDAAFLNAILDLDAQRHHARQKPSELAKLLDAWDMGDWYREDWDSEARGEDWE